MPAAHTLEKSVPIGLPLRSMRSSASAIQITVAATDIAEQDERVGVHALARQPPGFDVSPHETPW